MPRFRRPDDYRGINVNTVARIVRARDPATSDYRRPENNKNYEIGSIWVNSTNDQPWILVDITSNSATWVRFAGGLGDVISLTGDDAVVVPADTAGNIDILGVTVANATNGQPVYVDGDATAWKLDIEVQVAADITGAPGDTDDAGICSFDDTIFSVDADGFVTLTGGSKPTNQSFNVDFNTAPGTDPVYNTATGQISIHGSTVANGTNANYPIATHSRNVSTFEIEAQVAGTAATAPATMYDAGLASFSSNYYNVTSNGFVQPKGFQSEGWTNLGISYSAGVFTVQGADGTALSASNPAYVTLQSKANPGRVVTVPVIANQTFQDDAHASSQIVDNLFGFTTSVAITENVPFYLYACLNDSENAIAFGTSRVPHRTVAPATANIGTPSTANADLQSSIFIFNDVTIGDYDENPVLVIGAFRMRMSNSDDWTVQTLTTQDGVGNFLEDVKFTCPLGQFGADSGTYNIPNGGSPDAWGDYRNHYYIYKNGNVKILMFLQVNNTSCTGAFDARFSMIFKSIGGTHEGDLGSGYHWIASGNNVINVPVFTQSGYLLIKKIGAASNTYMQWQDFTGAGSTAINCFGTYKIAIE